MDDAESSTPEPRAKRQKTNHKTAVFERLKQLKGKGSKNKYEVSDMDNVYEVIDEKEYSKKVWERQDDDWIVDDDGSGYVEDGREIFDDDLDSESIAQASKTADGRKRKKNVSKNATKGNIQAMLSNMPEKKKEEVNLDQDDFLSDLISAIDESGASTSTEKYSEIHLKNEEEKKAKDYLKSFSVPKPLKVKLKTGIIKPDKSKEKPQRILKELPVEDNVNVSVADEETGVENEYLDDCHFDDDFEIPEEEKPKEKPKELPELKTQEEYDNCFEEDFDIEDLEAVEKTEEELTKKVITEENLINGWETMQKGVKNEDRLDISIKSSELPLTQNEEGASVFRFFWWDAHEDYIKQPGTVFLFGKTYIESAKSYASCCVVVRNVERKLYLLPRPFLLDDCNKETDTPVKMVDVYREFNETISETLRIPAFRSRKVSKKYSFDPEIPTQSDYLEVRYAGKFHAVPYNQKGKTYSRIFGRNTNYLEILLLERKIKGPCWLEIKNPVPVKNPFSWCKVEMNCHNPSDLSHSTSIKNISPPPLVVATINIRTVPSKKMTNDIVMIGCLVHNQYFIDKQAPKPPFQQHFCVLTSPTDSVLPLDCHTVLNGSKATQIQKCDSERALLNYFLMKFVKIDPDLVVGHDLLDFHLTTLCSRLEQTKATSWSRFGRLKITKIPTNPKMQKNLMVGRLVCDLKVSARELIKSRSYDLDTLCQTVLKLKDNARPVLLSGDIINHFSSSEQLLKLISYTMQDAAHITQMMYELNVMPLALQITNIAGNVMSKTLMGGRAERNEFLLLHAFTEKDYICPDKIYGKYNKGEDLSKEEGEGKKGASRKKPTYSGGLVLDPKVGFYDKFILLMDFNSLYPSIIQEYNICFTTMASNLDPETIVSSTKSDPGILPTQIRKLVESRREVKKLMASTDISSDLRMQYNIRQLALKLTANSMYGCLGFQNSRFFAKHLASLVTMKGRDILLHTRDMVQSMGFEVIYGDTDSIMINTNIIDFDQVFKIGNNIKQAVNKSYRQVELEVDGVFKYMLLLKKKKYAAVTMSKTKSGEIKLVQEHKGLDIVRRDWSRLASEVGKSILNHILSDQSTDERIENIQNVLRQIANDLREGKVPTYLLIITKQLTKNPTAYTERTAQSHVLVAIRYNQKGGKPLTAGDTVPYVICEDGTNNSNTQRAYHIEELNKSDTLKIDVNYYLSHQIHPVVSRLCEPIEGLDAFQIANCLGIDSSAFKVSRPKAAATECLTISAPVKKYRNANPLEFTCLACQAINSVTDLVVKNGSTERLWLEKCANDECTVKPLNYVYALQNTIVMRIKYYIQQYYEKVLICEDPLCPNETRVLPMKFVGKYPVCNMCTAGVMYRKYTEADLYEQITFYRHLCDLSKLDKKLTDSSVLFACQELKESIDYFLKKSAYSVVDLSNLYKVLIDVPSVEIKTQIDDFIYEEDDDDF